MAAAILTHDAQHKLRPGLEPLGINRLVIGRRMLIGAVTPIVTNRLYMLVIKCGRAQVP